MIDIYSKEFYNTEMRKLLKNEIEEFTYASRSAEPEIFPQCSTFTTHSYMTIDGKQIFTKSVMPIHKAPNGAEWTSVHNKTTTLSLRKVQ